ncbi:nucleotidyltransferase domain-containing protein [Rubrivirga sp.]|uniref:nucleotidyltransferase domain-containing protein n=1 Tax=Rubrivirga sp. TaxID=1885344 RepID=UPI003B529E30
MTAVLPDSTPPHVRAALAEAKARLEAIYGDRLVRVVLYGSRARGDARPDSDVDLLVVLRGDYQAHRELKDRLVPVTLDLLDRYGVAVSAQPYGDGELRNHTLTFPRNVDREGVTL